MKNLKEKLRKNGGFTLVEMLIVVAIIAILIAVSIPMVGTALERSRHAVDTANARDAVSLASVIYLTDGKLAEKAGTATTITLNYGVDDTTHQGTIGGADAVQSQCTCSDNTKDGVGKGQYLTVVIDLATGAATPTWADAPSKATWSETDGYKAG